MRVESHKFSARATVALLILYLWTVLAIAQQAPEVQVPEQFKLDMETAGHLRPKLIEQSIVASGPYATGRLVFERLVAEVRAPRRPKFAWELRIVEDDELNAYSSPDGTVYVESGLGKLAGPSAGLWAAILSHEIAHVVRRDWARRYLYQKSLEGDGGAGIVLGDPAMPSASWTDSKKASQDLGRFCRQLEIDADREGLMLMARAGYHPDFVPALHHLLHARVPGTAKSLYAMHPCWEERDRELSRAYVAASIEFEHRWLEWYASPGGNPPVVVFADEPTVRRNGAREWEIQVPLRCQNLAGAVEVVLRAGATQQAGTDRKRQLASDPAGADDEVRQLTGCTSPRTTVTFTLADSSARRGTATNWTDVYVLDAWGSVLARADVPKLGR